MFKPVFLIRKPSAVSLWWPMVWFINEDVTSLGESNVFRSLGRKIFSLAGCTKWTSAQIPQGED